MELALDDGLTLQNGDYWKLQRPKNYVELIALFYIVCFRSNLLHLNAAIDRGVFVGGNAHERMEIGQEIRSCTYVMVFDIHSNS